MKSNHILLFITLLIGMVLIGGCENQTTPTQSSSDCKKYDGTWKGVIGDSGSIETTKYVNGESVTTHNPFTAQYDFEMTIEAKEEGTVYDENHLCAFTITHVKASHPVFNCQQGCTPVQVLGEGPITWMSTDKDGYGAMHIFFENEVSIGIFADDGMLRIMPEGNKIELYIPADVHDFESIGSGGPMEDYRTIETDNCYKMANELCRVEYINKNTIILNKIS